jgi:GntR family transcriptional repressor for pyruvate dehydrogenase complex
MTNSTELPDIEIRRESLSDQISAQIQRLIIEGGLTPGEKLPSERELAEQFGVSRTVIREAVKLLQMKGLVRVVSGSGTYVSHVSSEIVADSIGLFMTSHEHTFQDLLEIRRFLEVEIAGLAAERATAEDIQKLEESFSEMKGALANSERTTEDLERFVQADIKFHQLLSQATKNSLLPLLHDTLNSLLLEFSRKVSEMPGAPEKAVEYHGKVLECVRQKNIEEAQETMSKHLTSAERLMKRASNQFDM